MDELLATTVAMRPEGGAIDGEAYRLGFLLICPAATLSSALLGDKYGIGLTTLPHQNQFPHRPTWPRS